MLQTSILNRYAAFSFCFLLVTHAATAFCDDRFYVIWRNIGLPDAVRLISQYSGRKIRLAPEVQGTISVASIDPLTSDEIFYLFQKSLQGRGLILMREQEKEYLVQAAAPVLDNLPVTPNVESHQAFSRSSDIASLEQKGSGPVAARLSDKLSGVSLPVSIPHADERTEVPEVKPEIRPVTTVSESLSSPTVARHQHLGAIFATEQRAQAIVSRLLAAGGEAELMTSSDPENDGFSVILLYRDTEQGYQAMMLAIQRAGLNNLLSTPQFSPAFTIQDK
ncbi:MAG: hypothetical protein ABI188_06865 [Collimonas sp.]|uniref:hypothetical protein n=1 Tax=Collimonas sp. TaxID=1963772 RepID=UPI0032671619